MIAGKIYLRYAMEFFVVVHELGPEVEVLPDHEPKRNDQQGIKDKRLHGSEG